VKLIEQFAKSASMSKNGLAATLRALLGIPGTGAPSTTRHLAQSVALLATQPACDDRSVVSLPADRLGVTEVVNQVPQSTAAGQAKKRLVTPAVTPGATTNSGRQAHSAPVTTHSSGVAISKLSFLAAPLVILLALFALPASSAMATGDINHPSACPPETEGSPGFRAFLPDCRAFELVTPSFGAGQPAFGFGEHAPSISADGEHVVAISYGGFCGTEELEEAQFVFGALYEFSRTPGGWSCEALDPPASEYPRRRFDYPSADLSKSLWELVPGHSGEEVVFTPAEQDYDGYDLAVREATAGGKGRFTVLGPVVAPGHVVERNESEPIQQPFGVAGAAADLSHVLLSVISGF